MNTYIFQNVDNKEIRCIWLQESSEIPGCKSVVDIRSMNYDGSKEDIKNAVKFLYETLFIGRNGEYEIFVSTGDENIDYDPSLEGKARKQSSKEINVITAQLST